MARNDVLLERMENLLEKITEQHVENKEAHQALATRLDYTNGKVRSLQIWKGTILGGMAVISLIFGYFMQDYIESRKSLIQQEKSDALVVQRLDMLEQTLKK